MTQPNIVPFLGTTNEPIHFVSAWIPGVELSKYIADHPDANRLDLMGVSLPVLSVMFKPFQANWHR